MVPSLLFIKEVYMKLYPIEVALILIIIVLACDMLKTAFDVIRGLIEYRKYEKELEKEQENRKDV